MEISTRRFLDWFPGVSSSASGRLSAKPCAVILAGLMPAFSIRKWTTVTARADDRSQLERNRAVEIGEESVWPETSI